MLQFRFQTLSVSIESHNIRLRVFVYHLINNFSGFFGFISSVAIIVNTTAQKVVLYQSNFLLWSFFDIRSAFVFIVLYFFEEAMYCRMRTNATKWAFYANNGIRGNMRKKQVQIPNRPLRLEWLWCFKFQDEPENKTMSSFWCSVKSFMMYMCESTCRLNLE